MGDGFYRSKDPTNSIKVLKNRDVTDSASASDGIRHFFRNPKSDGYWKSDHVGFEIAN